MKKFIAYWEKIKFLLQQNKKITTLDITLFFRQFATLLTAGIPILQCCEMLEKCQIKIDMRLLIFSIKKELLSGKNVYSSLSPHKKYFDELTCQLIKIGEHTGNMDITFQMIADEHEKQLAFIKRIKGALFYPCIITCTALLVTISLILFVIPRFAELFSGTQIPLPALTRALFFISDILNQQMYLFFLPAFIFIPTPWTKKFNKKLFQQLLNFPFIHSFMKKILLARFARHFAMTFSAGIPLSDALRLLTHSSIHPEYTKALLHLRNQIHAGFHLHQAMQSSCYFPDLMIQMVKIGEESGSLDQLLFKIAGFFESDIDQLTTQFSRTLEPLIMLILGVLIGGLIIGMYLPIFKLGTLL